MRYSFSSVPGEILVTIRSKFSPFLFLFFPFWLVIAGEAFLTPTPEPRSHTILTDTVFGIATLFLTYQWLWNIAGKEELQFTASGLIYRRVFWGMSRTRIFRTEKICNPFFEESRGTGRRRVPSRIRFSYDGKEIRFGEDLTQQEANDIVAAILHHLPELREYWASYAEGYPELQQALFLKPR